MDVVAQIDLLPVPIWIEDFSAVRRRLDGLRAEGVTDLRDWLLADKTRVAALAGMIRVLDVNQCALDLFEADSREHLTANLDKVFRSDMLDSHIEELCQLWEGKSAFQSIATNYTLRGKRLSVMLKARALPGHEEDLAQVLLVTENITEREEAREAERLSRLDAEGLFEHSPVSLWIEDFSRIHRMLADLKARGIADLRVFTDVHPSFIRECMQQIQVLDVNAATLEMFAAPSREYLLLRLGEVFRDEMEAHFREQLIELWQGNLRHSREVVNYALDGSERVVIMRFSVLPGHESDWGRVLIALTDITARKKAEAYLAYLGKHDVLTGLNNRAHFIEQLSQLVRQGVGPLSMMLIDLNRLKETNDTFGHDAGDALLRRTGEVLREAAASTNATGSTLIAAGAWAARIGGDEFALVLPHIAEAEMPGRIEELQNILSVNNTFYGFRELSFSIGTATRLPNESPEEMIRRADQAMYAHKRTQQARKG